MATVAANEPIINMLQELAAIAQSNGEVHRRRAFLGAITSIKKYDKEIKSGKQVSHLPSIGKGTVERIDEFLKKGYLKEVKKDKSKTDILQEFQKIYGVSNKTSSKWYNDGYRSLKDIRKALKDEKIKMTNIQKLSLKYVGEYSQRIPRDEIKELNNKLKDIFTELKKKGLNIKFKITGSFLRGAKDSGDIDMLITDKDHQNTDPSVLTKIVGILEKKKIITHRLKLGQHKFTGLIVIDKLHRQLDIERTDSRTWASALIYFTGNKEFNQCTREIAKKKGYRLNEKGLFKKTKKKSILHDLGITEKNLYRTEPLFYKHFMYMALEGNLWKNMYLETEKDIFDELDMVYKKPTERNF